MAGSGSAQSPMLWFPAKTTEEVDLATPVKTLIQNSYGEKPSNFSDQLSTLNRTRQDAVKGAGSDATARDLLFKWFHMLEMLELRFPELRVPFPWKDAFTSKSISQHSLAYEKACVIFNIAATLSSFASSQARMAGNADGVKRAYTSYRQAAGMLTYINDNFLHAPSTDMSKEVVKCLTAVMLAQGSEVFLEKTIQEHKASSLIAKIASHVASMYHQAMEDMKTWVNRGVFDRQWLSMITTKEKHFSSVTQYYKALADEAAGQHGSCLVRLTVAEREAKEATALATAFHSVGSGYLASKYLPQDATTALTTITKAHQTACAERKAQAVKDNDLIYHDILPSESSLPAVDKLAAASPMTIQEVFATPEVEKVVSPDLFQRLVPMQVHESASLYSEEKAKLARAESERADLANGELEAALQYMGLPASLQMFKNVGTSGASGLDSLADPPAEVMQWSEDVARGSGADDSLGGGAWPDAIESAFGRLGALRSRVAQDMAAVLALLDDENRECEKARVKWGHEWTQEPSSMHTRSMRADLKSNNEALAAAEENDGRIQALWRDVQADVRLLAGGRPALERAFAEAITSSAPAARNGASLLDLNEEEDKLDESRASAIKALVSEIDALVVRLNKIKRERASTLNDMKEKIQSDDISQILVLHRRNANVAPTIFAQELEKFKPYQSRIALCNDQQQATLVDVTKKWKQLTEGKEAKDMQKKYAQAEASRRQLVERLRHAKDSAAGVRAAVSKGLSFYSDLQEIVSALKHNAQTFSTERKAERERLISEREWDDKLKADGGASGSGARSTSPPAPSYGAAPQQSSLHNAMASLSMGGPPPPPLPGQSMQQSQYSSAPPPAQRYASPPPSQPYQPPPPPPQSPYHQSSYSQPPPPQPQSPYSPGGYSSPAPSGLPPPPSHFQSSFSGGPLPPQPHRQSSGSYGYGAAPPPPPPPQHSGYGAPVYSTGAYGGPPPPPPPQHQQQPQSPYGMPPPPQAPPGGQYQQWQRPAY